MNNSYITIIKEKRTALSRKRIPLNQNGCTANFRIGVPFEQNLQYFFEAYKKISENSYFEFKFNKEIVKLYFNDIIYFESKNRLIFIFTNLKVYKFYGKLNDIEEQVRKSNKSFLRIHQSYLVNYDYIKIIRYQSVVMKNEIELQISEDRKKLIRNSLMQIIEEN